MAAGYQLPLAAGALLLATAVTLLVATSAVPAVAATAADKYSGRMVIRAPGARVVVSAGGAATLNNWQQRRRRHLVEDEVAPESGGLLGAANGGGSISASALNKDRGICLPHAQCAACGLGGSNTRPCTFKDYCPHTPTAAGAGHARAVHV